MGTFAFRAVDVAGTPSRGELEAASKAAVTEQLRARGLIVLDVEEQRDELDIGAFLKRHKKVKARSLVVFSRQFATMIGSGMSMLRSLYTLEDQTEDETLQRAIVAVREDVEAGASLSVAMGKHPRIFDELFVSMVHSGEGSGQVEQALDRIAFQLEKNDQLRREIKSAMAYPVLVMGFSGLVLFGLVAFLVPVFAKTFNDIAPGSQLPSLTRFTVGLSHLVVNHMYVVPLMFIVPSLAFKRMKKTRAGLEAWDRLKLRLPVKIGDVVHKIALARWSRTLSGLVAAGVPLLHAIDVTGKTAGNTQVENVMREVHDSVKRGGTLAAPLREADVFPNMVAHMVGAGEETGALEHMLGKIADFYEAEVEANVKALTSILEPLMIVMVGGMVGFIVISMYLPMFSIYDKIQ